MNWLVNYQKFSNFPRSKNPSNRIPKCSFASCRYASNICHMEYYTNNSRSIISKGSKKKAKGRQKVFTENPCQACHLLALLNVLLLFISYNAAHSLLTFILCFSLFFLLWFVFFSCFISTVFFLCVYFMLIKQCLLLCN